MNMIAGEKKSSSGFCLHNGGSQFIYYVPKENHAIDPRMPKEARGKMMTGQWYDPFTGSFGEPFREQITQWPRFIRPQSEGFQILILEIE